MARPLIGIDIGSSAIRGACVEMRKGRPVVTHAAEIPLPDDTIVGGELRDPTVLANALRLLRKAGGFSGKTVVIGVANQQTLVRQVDLAFDPEEDFKAALPFKVAQDLPVDASELTLDYYGLGDYRDADGVTRRRALLVGAMSSTVENFTQASVDAGLQPVSVDFSAFALIRAAAYAAGTDPSSVPAPPPPGEEFPVEVLVDVGAALTIVAVHHHGRPIFVRLVPGGGASVTRAISDHLDLRWEVCEALKRVISAGSAPANKAVLRLVSEVPKEQIPVVRQIMNMMGSTLAQSVRESVEYFLAASPQVSGVSRVLLSGGGVLLGGYGERIAGELRTEVELLTPMQAFASGRKAKQLRAYDPRFGIATGLAIGAG